MTLTLTALYSNNANGQVEEGLANSPIFNNNNGSLKTVQNIIIPNNSYLKVLKDNHPFVTVKVYNAEGEELFDGRPLEAAKYWFDKATVVTNFSDIVELISSPLTLDPAEDIRLEDCLRANTATDILRTIEGSGDIRVGDDLGGYFTCYQKKSSAINRYNTAISPAIKKITDNYDRTWEEPLPAAEFETL